MQLSMPKYRELYIAEKSELAKAIVDGLGGGDRKAGYWVCGDVAVVPCVGHMVELWEPHRYDERYAIWNLNDLPWVAIPWEKSPVEKTISQYETIMGLIKETQTVVHAGDPDDEGQLIVDEILKIARFHGPVKRLTINDNNIQIVRRELANMKDNSEFVPYGHAAEARSVGDLLLGVNLSRLYTLVAQARGFQGTFQIGRVKTAVLGLIVRRCRENAAHKAAYYYNVTGSFDINGIKFPAKYKVIDADPTDEKGRLNDKAHAEQRAAEISGKPATVLVADTEQKEVPAPLPYNLLKLQTDASRKFGMKPDYVLKVSQSLRDDHKLITYNRTDTEYLNDVHHEDAPLVLEVVAKNVPMLAAAVQRADPKIKSRAFNESKVQIHHGIIPTQARVNFEVLSADEQKIYMLIARQYVAQFWPKKAYERTSVTLEVAGHTFTTTASTVTNAGWYSLYKNDTGNEDIAADADDIDVDLRALVVGEAGANEQATAEPKETKAQPLYKIDTLLGELTKVAKYIRDPHLRNELVQRDKDKAGEHGGIGTPATRHTIIAELFEDDYIVEKSVGRGSPSIVCTEKAFMLYDVLPDELRFPDMTARWHEQAKSIIAGERDTVSFVNELMDYIKGEVERVRRDGLNIKCDIFPCPNCRTPLLRRKSNQSQKHFWFCPDREKCKVILNDQDGKPAPRAKMEVSKYKCGACGKGLIRRTDGKPRPGKSVPTPWWSCSGFPDCTQRYSDKSGLPDYDAAKAAASKPAKAN